MSQLNDSIRARKSVYPHQYIDKPIQKDIIKELLENANHAPTHKLTEPWRFKIFMDEAKPKLGEFLAQKYKATVSAFSQSKYEKILNNVSKSGAVIAILLHRDLQERVPEWEEIASLACAVQNIWISCSQYELGGYWSSPAYAKFLGEHVTLAANEQCLGFFFLGHCETSDRILQKGPIEEKTTWFC